jgi:hypothetical protein
MGKEKKVVQEVGWGKVIIMDSAAQMSTDEAGQIVVIGSHGAEPTARHVARFLPFGVMLNDAGKGKNNAGISGLPVLEAMGILGATVDCMSARIGDGQDNYSTGIISAVNDRARAGGVKPGMPVIEACKAMSEGKKSARRLYVTETIYEIEKGRIILADSVSFLNENHLASVVVCGSHCSHTTFEFVRNLGLKGIILNDAGKGKDKEGISGLPVYEQAGIPAAAVDCMTAMIGNARDAWEAGLVSARNDLAAGLGVEVGTAVKEAAKKFLNKG